MKVLVVGSGAREHALCWKIAQSPLLTKLFAAPGNAGMTRASLALDLPRAGSMKNQPGMTKLAECIPLKSDDVAGLLAFAKNEKIDLTIVGPEAPLVAGIVDEFQREGLKIFGPSQAAARLEGSKAFAKVQMSKFGIPTADYEVFGNINEAKQYCVETEMPVVIKADGLAAGKGVMICDSSQEAVAALTVIMADKAFGDAGKKVVIEKKLEGEEVSILALSDGEKIIPLASSQDHKRAYDSDRGPNTGGMGAYSPCPFVNEEKFKEIIDLAVRPMIQGMAAEGTPYRGLIYAGIMLTKEGPRVLEYNCRFGDPETQVVLPRMKSDLLPILMQIAEGRLISTDLEWYDKACITVVIASGGYPGFYHTGFPIEGLESASGQEDVFIFHAGTALNEKQQVVTAGGRVLTVTAAAENLKTAFDRVYAQISKIHFQGSFYRRDIGRRAMEVLR